MQATETVHVAELLEALAYSNQGSISNLVRAGEIAAPQYVLGADRRWKRGWPRAYIDDLLRNPPPRVAARLSMHRQDANRGISRSELAAALGVVLGSAAFHAVERLMDGDGVEKLTAGRGRPREAVLAWLQSGPPRRCLSKTRTWLGPAMRTALHRLFGDAPPSDAARKPAEAATAEQRSA